MLQLDLFICYRLWYVCEMNLGIFVEDVFPDLYSVLSGMARLGAAGADSILAAPGYLLNTHKTYCPEVSFNISIPSIARPFLGGVYEGRLYALRNPGLLAAEGSGLLFTAVAATVLSRAICEQRRVGGVPRRDTIAYRNAVLAFGGMNISAIFAHNIFQKYTLAWRVAIDTDVSFTCCACIYLSLAPFLRDSPGSQELAGKERHTVERVNFLVATSACLLLKWFALYGLGIGFTSEVMYLGGVAVATAVSFVHFLGLCPSRPLGVILASLVFGACAAIVAHGTWFEQQWCDATEGWVSSVPLVFVGCLAAMTVMTVLHLKIVRNELSPKGKKRE
jgi:hypothetical protein